eukprot:4965842-Prymnesium_polylepis.1
MRARLRPREQPEFAGMRPTQRALLAGVPRRSAHSAGGIVVRTGRLLHTHLHAFNCVETYGVLMRMRPSYCD